MLPQYTVPTRRRGAFLADCAFAAVCAFVFFLACSLTTDEPADPEVERIAQAERARIDTLKRSHLQAVNAYESGMSDAMESVRETPHGVALVQACMALNLADRRAH